MSKSRKIVSLVLYVGAAGCVLGFLIAAGADWFIYQAHPEWSAPYYAYVLARALQFLIPAALALVAAWLVSRKFKTFLAN